MVYRIKRIKQTVVYIATLCLCLALLACVPLEGEPEATNTPLPTHTPVPTATIDWFPATPTNISPSKTSPAEQDSPEPAPNREVLFEDDFSDETLWQTYNEPAYKIIYEPNALSVVVLGEKVEAESLSAYILPGNFYLEFTIETALCSENDRYGIVFWRNSVSGTYRLWVNCQGQLMVDRVLPEGVMPITKWESARKFVPNAPARNVFGIQAIDGQLDFFVNGSYQFSLQARSKLEGHLGLIARSAGDTPLSVRFSELIVYKPEP